MAPQAEIALATAGKVGDGVMGCRVCILREEPTTKQLSGGEILTGLTKMA